MKSKEAVMRIVAPTTQIAEVNGPQTGLDKTTIPCAQEGGCNCYDPMPSDDPNVFWVKPFIRSPQSRSKLQSAIKAAVAAYNAAAVADASSEARGPGYVPAKPRIKICKVPANGTLSEWGKLWEFYHLLIDFIPRFAFDHSVALCYYDSCESCVR